MNLEFVRKLTIPMEVKALYPMTADMVRCREERLRQEKEILSGADDRLLLIIGPCSADRQDSVLDYLSRLREVQERVHDRIFIVPRVYTDKPRSTGLGYMGMLHQPDPEEKPDMFKGIIATRELHMRVVRETGFISADEMLYPENHRYLDDLLGYVAVGARSVEDQQHRLTASGIDIPVGMKNPTSGDLAAAINALTAAQSRHTFIYRGWEVHSQGNPFSHVILRGYVDKDGSTHPNYRCEDLMTVSRLYDQHPGLKNPGVIVDTNHANSGKQYLEQTRIAREVMHSRQIDPILRKLVKGLMVESYLADGCQSVGGGIYGKSITDPCLGWEKTERFIYELAEMA